MTESEKARAYDEALERAKKLHKDAIDMEESLLAKQCEIIFPEIGESEDERIRKMLIDSFTRADMGGEIYGKGVTYKQVLAWLEKQGQVKESSISQHEIETCKENNDSLTSKDERIRKRLIDFFEDWHEKRSLCWGIAVIDIIAWLEKQGNSQDKGEISDGYHTFNELYYYRMLYNAAFFNMLPKEWVHKSKKHHDGEDCFGGGWFIAMANLPTGQISNHYELKDWDLFQIPEKEVADKWDGHTPQEAADRLHKYLIEKQGEHNPADKQEHPINYKEAEKACLEYRKMREDCGIKDPVMLDEIEEAYYNGATSIQKPAWSEEDEHFFNKLISFCCACQTDFVQGSPMYRDFEKTKKWLKSLKERLSKR